jgi:hypothetical protein
MGVYVYCHKQDYVYKSSITHKAFENDWFKLDYDGTVTVKGTHLGGYAWDGCSPKLKFFDIYAGTPEAVLTKEGIPKTYFASMIHDVLYQFRKDLKKLGIKRKEADRQLYNILKRDGFKLAGLYYGVVRAITWLWW